MMKRSLAWYILAVCALSALAGAAAWFYPQHSGPAAAPAPADEAAVPEADSSFIPHPSSSSQTLPPGVRIRFTDVTAAAGIRFEHVDGRTDMEYLMDSTGSGAAWIDYDQDGLPDLFLVQGHPFVPPL